MKKFLSIMLTAIFVSSMSTVAFAADTSITSSEAKTFEFTKSYVTSDNKTPATYPAETLAFDVEADEGNPDDTMITFADTTVDGNPDKIVITVPAYSVVGKYNYTITETAGNTQGVTYAEEEIGVQVLVTYNDTHTGLESTVTFSKKVSEDSTGKVEGIVNTYDLGTLEVSKEVKGKLGDQEKKFDIYVTFNATGDVKSDITYLVGTEEKTISASAFSEDKTETVTIAISHDETVKFTNIPAGITYTVVESDEYSKDTNINGENGYRTPEYTLSDDEQTIAANDVDTVKVINEKDASIDTGISMDTIPYMMMLFMVAAGMVMIVAKKRRYED